MPVLVGDKVVQHDHLIHCVFHAPNAQRLTAVQVMAVDRCAVILFHGLHHAPRTDQFRVRRDEILTGAVRDAVIPEQCIGDVGNVQSLRHQRCDHLIERLLHEGIASCFQQTPLPADDLPPLFQIPIGRVVWGTEIEIHRVRGFAQQDVTDVLREGIFEEVDALPLEITAIGSDPILIREAQAEAARQQHLRIGQVQRFQRLSHTGAAGGDAAVDPPCIERGTIHAVPF